MLAELISEIDWTAIGTWAGVIVVIACAAVGSYIGSIRTVNKIEVSVAQLYGKLQKEMMIELSAMRADIARIAASAVALHDWVEAISSGDTPHIATMTKELSQHESTLEDHSRRIITAEATITTLSERQKNGIERVGNIEGTLRHCQSCRNSETKNS